MPDLEDVSNAFPNDGIFSEAYDVGADADFNNMDNTIDVSPIPTLRVHKDHLKGQILGESKSAFQTRGKIQTLPSVRQAWSRLALNVFTRIKSQTSCVAICAFTKVFDSNPTTGAVQFLGRRFGISRQCKKQTIVANSTIEAEYVAATNCCRQVIWIQNQMMDYGFNFMNTKIYIDNESTISVIKNHVAHSRTKHIEIQFQFKKENANEKILIKFSDSTLIIMLRPSHQMIDVTKINFLVVKHYYLGFGESLERDIDGTEELLLPGLFILWLTKVSTDSAKFSNAGQKIVTDQAKEIKHLKAQIKKLNKKAKPVITHHKAWMKSASMKQRLAGKKSLKKKWMQKESVSKQGRKPAKAEPISA
ncbi:hypothetical protein Tco_0940148 [Tanacetum coccineum]|uniref:Uncharacterized protein n=1 Tax=Tanacetum coccineum TaxID=301880 RepID=A0ABQ5DMZ9_9ASTR